jgi:hypothetical protein
MTIQFGAVRHCGDRSSPRKPGAGLVLDSCHENFKSRLTLFLHSVTLAAIHEIQNIDIYSLLGLAIAAKQTGSMKKTGSRGMGGAANSIPTQVMKSCGISSAFAVLCFSRT